MEPISFDITTLTLGEAAEAEMASGKTLQNLMRSRMGLLLLALFVHELRSSGSAPSWSELSSRKVLDVSSSTPVSYSTETAEK